ncbi:MAG TPA: ABC transporter ATP-binding protein [Pirellulaceae bacterium]|nr:ABC transporter ATP-binding protein [Pirellulaceae bacterium]HMO92307.1 ABC transporter ATP-binding protein [Pirellulaceae bacterium]HMP69231.1 ABC transporter ATP-binding protein [Pirellulaceae bacterium]
MADLLVDKLTKSFPTPTDPLVVLHEVSFVASNGENIAVVGPSGSGKSTLLHVLGTLDQPTSGRVELLGADPFHLSERELAHFRNSHIGFVFQEHFLLPQLSALENVLIPAVAESRAGGELLERAHELLNDVGLSKRKQHRPAELSGGERQRVAVARALLMKPKLVLADEPTGSLDRANSEQIHRMLLNLQQREQVILICVTHNERLAEEFQRIMRFEDGKLVENG